MAAPKRSLPTLLPKASSSSAGQGAISNLKSTESPRKRQVVSNACNNCRIRKTKCDGTRPQCASCVKTGVHCEFVAPEGVNTRQAERERVAKYQSVIELIQKGSIAESTQAMQRIREAVNIEAAVNSIVEARLLLPAPSSNAVPTSGNDPLERPPIMRSYGRQNRQLTSPYDDSNFMFEKQYTVNARDQYVENDTFADIYTQSLPLSRWTTVSADDRHMNHLLNLFFTWDNIIERAFYRPIFEEDVVMDLDSAGHRPGSFCSQFLINALLAVSCLYTLDPVTFKDSEDSKSRGRQWADEAEVLLEKIDKPSIPLLQGLYALFVYEGNIGTGTKSVHYFLRSIDVYKALNDIDTMQQREYVDEGRLQRERYATSWCMWGFYCCEWRSSQAFGFRKLARKPKVAREWRDANFPLSDPDCIGYWWFPYPMSLQTQRSMQVEVRELDVKLSEIVEDALDFIYSKEDEPSPLANPQHALELYDAFVDWKLSCPSRIRFEEAVLPSTILLHIGLEVMLTAVLRPFSHMTKEQFGRFNPRERCYAHASSLMSAIWTFRAFAHVRFEYWLNHALGTAAYIVLRESEDAPIQMDTLIRACQCLHEMRASLPLATDVLSGIRAAFKRYKLEVPVYMRKYFDAINHRKDGLLHHAVAALLPSSTEAGRIWNGAELQLQELLDEFDNIEID